MKLVGRERERGEGEKERCRRERGERGKVERQGGRSGKMEGGEQTGSAYLVGGNRGRG